METLNFVMGISLGLLASMLIISFLEMLRIRKKIVQLERAQRDFSKSIGDISNKGSENKSSIMGEIREIDSQIKRTISEITREIDSRIKEEHFKKEMEKIRSDLKEIIPYTDRRIDKTIDALCLRMDERINLFLKEEEKDNK
jgi:hypothetical protein